MQVASFCSPASDAKLPTLVDGPVMPGGNFCSWASDASFVVRPVMQVANFCRRAVMQVANFCSPASVMMQVANFCSPAS
jgi:hypothetical protein